jgi:hypothetical protein
VLLESVATKSWWTDPLEGHFRKLPFDEIVIGVLYVQITYHMCRIVYSIYIMFFRSLYVYCNYVYSQVLYMYIDNQFVPDHYCLLATVLWTKLFYFNFTEMTFARRS